MDFSATDVARVLDLAARVKKSPATFDTRLAGKSVAMIFAKQSTRTRISFEVGIHQLGGQALNLSTSGGTGMQMGRGETVEDTARVLSRYVHAIVIRTFGQEQVDGLAEHGSIPVVNALTDMYHPCQALADLLTIREHLGDTQGKKLVYIGAANNVSNSLMLAGPRCGMDVVVCCPDSLRPNPRVLDRARSDAQAAGTRVAVEIDPQIAVKNADVIYTDTWVSMGEEAQAKELIAKLDGFQVTRQMMEATGKDKPIFMHCLPAHRGEEVSAEVMDGRWSVVFDEAENRLHAQKAVLLLLLGGESWS
jgi:ornithine carbamoyltransferase